MVWDDDKQAASTPVNEGEIGVLGGEEETFQVPTVALRTQTLDAAPHGRPHRSLDELGQTHGSVPIALALTVPSHHLSHTLTHTRNEYYYHHGYSAIVIVI